MLAIATNKLFIDAQELQAPKTAVEKPAEKAPETPVEESPTSLEGWGGWAPQVTGDN